MAKRLCVLCCNHFQPEIAAAVKAEGWPDVSVAAYEARCGRPPVAWQELQEQVNRGCTQVLLLGRACLQGLGEPPQGWPPVRRVSLSECFHLVAGASLVSDALARDAYLLTPGWLAGWRVHLRELGFTEENAAEFFHDFARELVLLDTGVSPYAMAQLAEFAKAVELPATRLAVGLDYTRLLLARLVAEWRLDEARREAGGYARERADHLAAMDFLSRMALLTDEPQAVTAIEELFRMLFAPEEFHYARFDAAGAHFGDAVSEALRRQIEAFTGEWAWTSSGDGFLLRIAHAGVTLGVAAVERLAFPEFREHYLNLALSVADVCGLAIENARVYRRMKETEEALRKSERSLNLAQAIAHIGHWEWDINSEEFIWSEEIFRIFGYEPDRVRPSRDAFVQAIHPADRAQVAAAMEQAREGGRFDLEYRIVLPTGKVRVVRGLGEVVHFGADRQTRIIGTIRDLSRSEPAEILGVIQDITEHKELEWKLQQEARTDPLTGCANRRHFLQQAAQEYGRVHRYGGELSLLMLDLDHFKRVNDQYGHRAGDVTLQQFARACHSTLREEDLIGRVGGEEFGVLLPETGRERAREVAERLRQEVAAAEVVLPDQAPIHITTSVGVATLEPDDSGPDTLIARADVALYQAKDRGRNSVVEA